MKLRVAHKILKRSSDFVDYRTSTFQAAASRVPYSVFSGYFSRLLRNMKKAGERRKPK
jgi:hypothetical protein